VLCESETTIILIEITITVDCKKVIAKFETRLMFSEITKTKTRVFFFFFHSPNTFIFYNVNSYNIYIILNLA